ncbi:uncharacterized protein LOC111087728 [Limulus polyphemus]|uniref:Uncharacterized protein LOC111087728 n=1 Tax=Limulus polyphemus TaxID=6850 RepID=A0ABM1T5B3_LIMPO|nr:uncharacterized protein LOC111087728 [Limulus polyphemus]
MKTVHKKYLPLKGKIIYFDLRSVQQKKQLSELFQHLGGIEEEFLVKEINYVVTDRKQKITGNSSQEDQSPVASISSPFGTTSAGLPGSVSSPLMIDFSVPQNKRAQPVLSRGKALVDRANKTIKGTTDVFEFCNQWRIKVVHLSSVLIWLDKLKKKQLLNVHDQQKQNEKNEYPKNSIELTRLQDIFIKIEDIKHYYRTLYKLLGQWPEMDFTTSKGSCPFSTLKPNVCRDHMTGGFVAEQQDITTTSSTPHLTTRSHREVLLNIENDQTLKEALADLPSVDQFLDEDFQLKTLANSSCLSDESSYDLSNSHLARTKQKHSQTIAVSVKQNQTFQNTSLTEVSGSKAVKKTWQNENRKSLQTGNILAETNVTSCFRRRLTYKCSSTSVSSMVQSQKKRKLSSKGDGNYVEHSQISKHAHSEGKENLMEKETVCDSYKMSDQYTTCYLNELYERDSADPLNLSKNVGNSSSVISLVSGNYHAKPYVYEWDVPLVSEHYHAKPYVHEWDVTTEKCPLCASCIYFQHSHYQEDQPLDLRTSCRGDTVPLDLSMNSKNASEIFNSSASNINQKECSNVISDDEPKQETKKDYSNHTKMQTV